MCANMGGKQTVAGAGLKDDVVGPDIGQHHGKRGEIDRRGELLPFHLFLAAHGLGREPVKQVADGGDVAGRLQAIGSGPQMFDQRVLKDLETVTLGPQAIGIAPAKGLCHGRAEVGAGDRSRGRKMLGKDGGGVLFSEGHWMRDIGHAKISPDWLPLRQLQPFAPPLLASGPKAGPIRKARGARRNAAAAAALRVPPPSP